MPNSSGSKKSLPNGKHCLTVEEACVIISASAKEGVTTLKWGDLEVTFGRPQVLFPEPSPFATIPGPPQPVPNHEDQDQEALLAEEVRLREERIAEVAINDPVEYERMVAEGELDDAIQKDPE
jgi:hypothetical protein